MRIPADVDREDPLVFGLSARQLCILACAVIVAWLLYEGARLLVPLPVAAAVATPVAAAGLAVALGQRHGMSGDRFALAAFRHARAPHRLVSMSDDAVPSHAMRRPTATASRRSNSRCVPSAMTVCLTCIPTAPQCSCVFR